MEMMNILDDFMNIAGKQYMHLIPSSTTTMEPLDQVFEQTDIESVADGEWDIYDLPVYDSWIDFAVNTAKGCHDRMKQMMSDNWYYEEEDVPQSLPANGEIVMFNDGEFELADKENKTVSNAIDHDSDLFLMSISAIMLLVVICGVLFAGYRYLRDQKEKKRMNVYVKMQQTETDKF